MEVYKLARFAGFPLVNPLPSPPPALEYQDPSPVFSSQNRFGLLLLEVFLP